jgi:hypothetical protein
MAKGDAKADPRPIIAAHYRSLSDQNTGKQRWQDHAWLEGLPTIVAAVLYVKAVRLPGPASAGLLTVTGILGAFLFGAMLNVAERAASWAEKSPATGKSTSALATYMSELAGNSGYAALTSIVTSTALVVTATSHGTVLRVASAVSVALAGHLVATLLMIMKRIFVLTEGHLVNARTGAEQGSGEH